jgi:hypothetical protein
MRRDAYRGSTRKKERAMSTRHGFGPELGRTPVTYTCVCGFRSTDYAEIGCHITDEYARAHEPRHLTMVPAVGGSEMEIASTPHGDENNAVEVRVVVRESDGRYRRHMVLVRRDALPFLIEELEAHRVGKDAIRTLGHLEGGLKTIAMTELHNDSGERITDIKHDGASFGNEYTRAQFEADRTRLLARLCDKHAIAESEVDTLIREHNYTHSAEDPEDEYIGIMAMARAAGWM